MNGNLFVNFFTGFLTTILLFFFCFFIVVGAKSLQVFLQYKFLKNTKQNNPTLPKTQKKPKASTRSKPKQPKVIKSIEIDPMEIDKIYVKRSS